MSNYNTTLQANNADLQTILNVINELPEAGGIELPTLTNEGTATDLVLGKQLIDDEGNIVTGTMPNNGDITATMDGINVKSITIPAGCTTGGTISLDNTIDNEISTQANLISQIQSVADSLPNIGENESSGSEGEGANDCFAVKILTNDGYFMNIHPFKSGMTWREYSESSLCTYFAVGDMIIPNVEVYEDPQYTELYYMYHDYSMDSMGYYRDWFPDVDNIDEPIRSYVNDGYIYTLSWYPY